MEKAKVFISSVLNRSVEDLREERDAVKEVVESYGFLTAWAFEKAPASFEDLDESYLRNVDECDIFTLIVGAEASNPVTAEVQRAKQQNKRILAFAKKVSSRKPMAQMLLDGTGTKYASFETQDKLRDVVRDAIDHAVVMGLRSLSFRTKSPMGELKQLAEKKTQLHIKPAIPRFAERDVFNIEEMNAKTVVVAKHSTAESLEIPTGRISEILFFGDMPSLILDGRLQWVSTIERWRFFPEKPEERSALGFSKLSTPQDPHAETLANKLRSKGYQPGWAAEVEVPSKQSPSYQVVYDEDGHFFRIAELHHS
jgi:Domain of unknown function (DUF4062)